MKSTILRPALIAVAALGLAGCSSYDDGYGYGYSRVSLGYGNYHQPYYGWYDNYYYPGTGYYVYDRYGSRHRWNDRYRNYWADERLAELGIEIGLDGERAQALDLLRLPPGVAGREAGSGLVLADCLSDAEPFGQHVDQRRIDVVDALAVTREHRIGLRRRLGFACHQRQG